MVKKKAISLIELMIVLALASSLIMGLVSFIPKKPRRLSDIIKDVESYIVKAYDNALLYSKNYQVRFFFSENNKLKKIGIGKVEDLEKVEAKDILPQDLADIKDDLFMTKIAIGGINELARGTTKETYILIYKEGYTQEVDFGVKNGPGTEAGNFRLNPFKGSLEYQND